MPSYTWEAGRRQRGRTIQKAVCRPFTRSPMPEQCAPFLHCSRISIGLHGVPSRCAGTHAHLTSDCVHAGNFAGLDGNVSASSKVMASTVALIQDGAADLVSTKFTAYGDISGAMSGASTSKLILVVRVWEQ